MKKKDKAARCQAEEEAESAREAKLTTKVQERKAEEEGKMHVDEEEQETGRNGTATDTNNEGNTRKKARKARKQLQRKKQGNKWEQEAKKTATSAATGAKVSPVFSSPVGVKKTSTKFSPQNNLIPGPYIFAYSRIYNGLLCAFIGG